MQEEREGLDRAAVVKFLSRRIKNLKMRARCRHIDLSQSLKLIKQQVESTEEEESIKDAIETELVGRNRATVTKYLRVQLRKRQRANKKKGVSKDRHKPTAKRKQDRHKNPSADRHKRAVDPNRGGTMRDFFWHHRECSAMHCAANFAMEAASSKYWSDEDIAAWCVPVDDDDLVKVAHEYIKETKNRSNNKVCSVCGVVGLDGAGREVRVNKLSVHDVGDIEDDSDWARINRRERDGELTAEAAKKRKEILHTTVVGGKRLRLYEKGVHGLQCMMCSSCQSQHKDIWK